MKIVSANPTKLERLENIEEGITLAMGALDQLANMQDNLERDSSQVSEILRCIYFAMAEKIWQHTELLQMEITQEEQEKQIA